MAADTAAPNRRLIVLAAGGTGGHLFPAQALAEALIRRGFTIHLMTDERVKDYGKDFPAAAFHEIPSATLNLSEPFRVIPRFWRLANGYATALATLRNLGPAAVVGFGGYPSLPPVLAASRLKIPTCIHDQNAVMGRANRILARFATIIASSFPEIVNLPEKAKGRLRYTGNPVRAIVIAERGKPFRMPKADEPFRLVIFGGSQGARFFAEFGPQLMKALPNAVRRKLNVVQQCRPEDLERVGEAYKALGVAHDLQAFFSDLPKRIAEAQLVLCRSGASTVAELAVIGRPAIYVPLPHAVDNDQLRNAEFMAKAGAGWVRQQAQLTAEDLAAFVTRLRYDDGELLRAASAALEQGRPDAAERLAELVEELATGPATIERGHHNEASP
jgi:UDP-N-acetylglucosamine--N-acetylmuramyl-(pentapeptide) pyrophosphoryl-undecaprenol N-acetylglucosamine transferase